MKGRRLEGRRRKRMGIKAWLTHFDTDCTNLEYNAEGRPQPFLFWHWLLTQQFLFSVCPLPADSGRRIMLRELCVRWTDLSASQGGIAKGRLLRWDSEKIVRTSTQEKKIQWKSQSLKDILRKDPPSSCHIIWQPGATTESSRTAGGTGHLQLFIERTNGWNRERLPSCHEFPNYSLPTAFYQNWRTYSSGS